MFLLSFFLCGVNFNDIFRWENNILKNGYIVFVRKKIEHHEPDPIKIKLQAEAILKKYKGKEHLLNLTEKYGGNYSNVSGYLKKESKLLDSELNFLNYLCTTHVTRGQRMPTKLGLTKKLFPNRWDTPTKVWLDDTTFHTIGQEPTKQTEW